MLNIEINYKKKFKLSKIINLWFFSTIFFNIIIFILTTKNGYNYVWQVWVINIFFLLTFQAIIKLYLNLNAYNKNILIITVLTYSLLFVLIINFFYYQITNEYFEFSARDTYFYDVQAKELIKNGFKNGISFFLENHELADLGAVLFTSLSYIIFPSPLVFNIFNIFIGVYTVLILYKISLNFMNDKYAFFCALTYGLSSFIVYLYSTGMKESFFVFFIVQYFYRLSNYWIKSNKKELYVSFLFLLTILLFRPAVMFMILVSTFFAIIFRNKNKTKKILWGFLLIFLIVVFYEYFISFVQRFSVLTRPEVVNVKNALTATNFNYIASFIASIFGPLPTYLPDLGREQQSFYSIGLGFRVFLTYFFIHGFYYSLKKKNTILIAMGSFVVIEMVVLALILESFELRLNSPHIPFIFLLSFFSLEKLNQIKKHVSEFLFSSFSFLLIVFWNLRIFL